MSKEPHPPGTFCWAELATSDGEGAKAFYTGMFDWQANDDPLPELQPDFVDAVSAQSPSAIGPKAERGQAGIFLAVHLPATYRTRIYAVTILTLPKQR